MKTRLFFIFIILSILLGLYIYIGATFELYKLVLHPQILIGIFLIMASFTQLFGRLKPHLAYLFIVSGILLIILYWYIYNLSSIRPILITYNSYTILIKRKVCEFIDSFCIRKISTMIKPIWFWRFYSNNINCYI